MSESGEEIELKEDEEDVFRTAEELGLDLSGMGEGRGVALGGDDESLDDLDT